MDYITSFHFLNVHGERNTSYYFVFIMYDQMLWASIYNMMIPDSMSSILPFTILNSAKPYKPRNHTYHLLF